MRRDTQIGIVLGVVILVVIGVFFSTRPSIKEPKIPDLALSQEGVSKGEEIEIIDIGELAKKSKTEITEETVSVEDFIEERKIKREFGRKVPVKVPVKLEGAETEIVVTEKDISEVHIPEKEIEEFSESTTIPKEEQQIPFVNTQGDIIHKVVSSDSLAKLSKEYYGDETKWKYIHEANENKIPNPNVLYIGLELLIPDITVLEKRDDDMFYENLSGREPDEEVFTTTGTHIVRHGDTLFGIARKYYGDTAMWDKIYDANEDTIVHKRLLEVGQTLIIPE
ncbi:MAG: LysM peptidoglycan-binding domain-containing protein [Candidatus Scalindua sediminis]|nr:LysM peptidoglycan-binding domain-containing protein [Candidatus Scalindua sediminis]